MSWIGANRAISAIDWIEENKPKNGEFIVYYLDGHNTVTLDINESVDKQIRWRMKFKNGKRADGPSYGYYPEGNIKQIINWKDGEMDGHLVRFYPNGMVTDVFYFSKGIRDGYWYHKLPCGFLESEGEYINGEQIWKKNYKKDA